MLLDRVEHAPADSSGLRREMQPHPKHRGRTAEQQRYCRLRRTTLESPAPTQTGAVTRPPPTGSATPATGTNQSTAKTKAFAKAIPRTSMFYPGRSDTKRQTPLPSDVPHLNQESNNHRTSRQESL